MCDEYRSDLTNAHYTKQLVVPAIEALGKITAHAVGCVEAHEKIVAFGAWLQAFVENAEGVFDKGQRQFEARPQRIINAAACRLLEIPECIIRENAAATSKAEAHARKVEELLKRNFSKSEIEAILPCPQEEIDIHTATILNLKSECQRIETFLSGAPLYDVGLLDLEKLSRFLQHHSAE